MKYYSKYYAKIGFFILGLSVVGLIIINSPKYNFYNKKRTAKVTDSKYNLKNLTPQEYEITQNEGTEAPFTNKYWDNKKEGIYVDTVSGKALFSSKDKYMSGSGWPSFTKSINQDEIKTKKDNKLNSERIEIHSQSAKTHLGHVFNDGPKEKGGKRFCVNSASLKFIPLSQLKQKGYEQYLKLFGNKNSADSAAKNKNFDFKNQNKNSAKTETATLAGGCFWGVEHLLKKLPGVISSQAGYIGGTTENPTYKSISTGLTSHAEAVQIVFDPQKISYKEVLSYFWRLHNPTELNRQGPDVGTQYRSAIFYHSELQKDLAKKSLAEFDNSGVFKKKVVTQIIKTSTFYPAEEYHQDYFKKNTGLVCHTVRDK